MSGNRDRGAIRHCAWLALLALALAGGCAMLPRHPPRIEVTGVRIDRIVGPDAQFTVALSLTNPDANDIAINALDGSLAIEGERVAEATLKSPVNISAGGTAQAELSARAGMDVVLRAVAAAMRRGVDPNAKGPRPTLHYAFEGSATLANGARLSFGRSGDVGE